MRALDRLQRNSARTVWVHPGPEGVEYPSNAYGDVVLTVEVEKQSLRHPLSLVVASSDPCCTTTDDSQDTRIILRDHIK